MNETGNPADAAGADPYGLSAAAERADGLKPVLDDLRQRSDSIGLSLVKAFEGAIAGGKSLDETLKSVALKLSNMALGAALKPLENALSGSLSDFSDLLAKALSGAKGAGGGGVTPFAAGGVVAAPTFFSSGGGTGLMGEAGAEAILPLRRGADGSLGVSLSGGAGASQPIVFNVTATDADSFRRSEAQLSAMLARTVRRGQRAL